MSKEEWVFSTRGGGGGGGGKVQEECLGGADEAEWQRTSHRRH